MTRVAKSTPCAGEIKDATGVNLVSARPVSDLTLVSVLIPIKTTNPNNGQTGNTKLAAIIRGRARKANRTETKLRIHSALATLGRWRMFDPFASMISNGGAAVGGLIRLFEEGPVTATITRLAPSNGLDPHDGLGAALKGVIDGVADALGLKNDRDERVTWVLQQERAKAYGVRVEIRRRET